MKQHLLFLVLTTALTGPVGAVPRLETPSVRWNGAWQPNSEVELQVRVVNSSREVSRGALCAVYYQGRKIGSLQTPLDLPPGGEVTLGGKIRLPQGEAPASESELELRVTPYKVADLAASDLAVEPTADGLRWTATITNQGLAPAPALPYRLLWDGQKVQEKKLLEALGPGESRTLTWQERRALPAGKHALTLVVDPDHELEDGDPNNNEYRFDWQPTQKKADLALREWNVEPPQPQVGSPARVLFTVANSGDIDLYRVPVTFKVDGATELDKTFYQTVPAQGEVSLTLPWIPRSPGEHRLSLTCAGGSLQTLSRNLTVAARPGYKLQLVSANIPRRSPQGKEWEIEVAVRNAGTLAGEGVKAVLWIDGARGWSARLPQPLAPGAQATLPLRWTAGQPGPHTLRLEVTAQGVSEDQNGTVNHTYNVTVDPVRE